MLPLRLHHLAVVGMAVLIPLATGGSALAAVNSPPIVVHRGQAPRLSQADVDRLADDATKRSIVIFKDQHPEAPSRLAGARRAQAVEADQAAVRGELSQLNARDVRSFHLVNAVAATISQAEIDNLSINPDVLAVVPDAVRRFTVRTQAGSRESVAASGTVTPQQICPPDPKVPLLEPEALQVMNVEFQPGSSQAAAHDLVDGTGIKVGILSDGLDPTIADLKRNGTSIVFDYQDFSGFGNTAPTNGREAFNDAGAIGSQGTRTYDLADFVNPAHPLPPGCNIRIKGVAPGVNLAVMNLFGSNPGIFNSTIIQAIEWAVEVDEVDVLNESIGGNPIPDTRNDPVQLANAAAVAAGVVVVASTGDAGPTNTTGSTATSDGVIAVAGTTTYRIYRQTTLFGTQLSEGGWLSNNISALSGGGTSEFGFRTPDVAAPSDGGWTLCSADTAHYFGCSDPDKPEGGKKPPPILAFAGTSLSCPLVSGTVALVIQAYQKTHHGVRPRPELVKRIIVSSADDLGAPADHQGAGLVNSLKAVQLAMSIHDSDGAPAPQGDALLVSKPNLKVIAPAGHHRSFSIDVTNSGTSPRKLSPTLVALEPAPLAVDSGSVSLSATAPTFIDSEGRTASYTLHQFDVPAGGDYLNGDIGWDGQNTGASVFETLFDPSGRVAANSLLGATTSGHGHVEVRQPSAGTWTAAIFTLQNAEVYSGKVKFAFTIQRLGSAGSVSPAQRTLQPGQTVTLDVSVNAVNQPGDHVATLKLTTGSQADGGIPVVIRSLVELNPNAGGAFDAALTGGGSLGTAGQRLTYQFDVPAGKPSLNVALQLANVNYDLLGFLTDPSGMPRDVQSTGVIGPDGLESFGSTMQFWHGHPRAGRWTLSLLVNGPITGAHLQEPFHASIDFKPPSVVAHGVPNSPTTRLTAGRPVQARIDVVNSGTISKDFFADARLRGKALIPLAGSGVSDVPLPLSVDAQPTWFVPTSTDLLIVGAQGSVPIILDVSATYGDPERAGISLGDNVSLAFIPNAELFAGFFFGLPEPVGPFAANGLPQSQTVNLAAVARTNPFDTAITSDTGDVWQQSVDQSAVYTPLTLGPGQAGSINLVLTPHAPPGTVVHGFVAIDTFNLVSASGDELIELPYSYTVR